MERALAVADQPITAMNFDFDDLDYDDLHAGSPAAPVKAPSAAAPVPSLSGTSPICIRVPARVIHAFKAESAKTGRPYQTMMNRALKIAAEGFL